MTQGIHQLTASMVNQLNRVDVISNNLANANTVGFKEENLAEGSFNRYLRQQEKKDEVVLKESKIMDTIPKIDTSYTSKEAGAIITTGNPLDFAIQDPSMFFKVQNAQGDVEYTRDGSFKILDNTLVNQNGYPILDNNNNPINTTNPNFKDTIGLIQTDFTNLDKVGNNNYTAKSDETIAVVANPFNFMNQYELEKSNVNTIKTMVGLIEAQRKFEQSQKALTGIDEINGKVIDSIGNGR
ncbi:MAG: flagellar hook-basal body protein [Arcobacteraceae bacterium]